MIDYYLLKEWQCGRGDSFTIVLSTTLPKSKPMISSEPPERACITIFSNANAEI